MDWLLPARAQVVVDLGAGTGLLSRALARKVAGMARVIAVEPDARMAAVLRARSPGVAVAAGRGEAIPLPDASADGVFASSAWHWMDPERAAGEIARVLRDGGRFGLIWTSRDRQAVAAPARIRLGSVRPTAGARTRRHEITLPGAMFGPAQTASFTFTSAMTISDILGMLATYSRFITASPPDRAVPGPGPRWSSGSPARARSRCRCGRGAGAPTASTARSQPERDPAPNVTPART